MIDLAAIGRHPTYWPPENADNERKECSPALDFDPSRWLNHEDQGTGTALPFSSGHRMCPGKRFAEVEMCAVLARFFTQFSLRLVPAEIDILEAKLAGYDQAWVEQRTKERTANALFEGLGFGHGIYPKSHTLISIIPRLHKGKDDCNGK